MNEVEQRSAQLLAELPTAVRREVVTTVGDELHHTLDGLTVEAAIKKLQDIAANYGEDAKISADSVYSDEETGYKLSIRMHRKENDSEWMSRRSKELADTARHEAREREALARLAEKYGYAPATANAP